MAKDKNELISLIKNVKDIDILDVDDFEKIKVVLQNKNKEQNKNIAAAL